MAQAANIQTLTNFDQAFEAIANEQGFTFTQMETKLAKDAIMACLSFGELGCYAVVEEIFEMSEWKSRRSFGSVLGSLVSKGFCATESDEEGLLLCLSYRIAEGQNIKGEFYQDVIEEAIEMDKD